MLDELRKPFFIVALILMLCVVLVEIGSAMLINFGDATTSNLASNLDAARPGYGIIYLSFLDALVFYVTLLVGLALVVPERIQGRIQGCATAIVSLLGCLGMITAIFLVLAVLILMLTLLLSPIFGTIAYFAVYAGFNRDAANLTLGLIMTLKIAFVIFLFLAQQRFLQGKTLVLLILTSFLANLIISLLHNLVPVFLVSITDVIGAIIVAVVAVIWAFFFLIGAVISIVKAIR